MAADILISFGVLLIAVGVGLGWLLAIGFALFTFALMRSTSF